MGARSGACRALYITKGPWVLSSEESEKLGEDSKLGAAFSFCGIQELGKKKKELGP